MVTAGDRMGSGVVVSSAGYVLTGNHVVHGSKSVEVTFDNRERVTGEVVHADANRDLALIKLPAQGSPYPYTQLGNPFESDDLQLGDTVTIRGYPAYSGTWKQVLTDGVICGFPAIEGVRYIQSSAAVYPGNSGGPVFNRRGEVIGIVNGKYTSLTGACATFATAISEADALFNGIPGLEGRAVWKNSVAPAVRLEGSPHVGCRTPDFTLKAADGKPYTLRKYEGRKVMLVFPGHDTEANMKLLDCLSKLCSTWPRAQVEAWVVCDARTGAVVGSIDKGYILLNDEDSAVTGVFNPDGGLLVYFIDRFGDIKIRKDGALLGCYSGMDHMLRQF